MQLTRLFPKRKLLLGALNQATASNDRKCFVGQRGLSSCSPGSVGASKTGVGIIGAPFSKGQAKDGTERGPQAVRDGGLVGEMQRLGWNVKDYGDLVFERSERDTGLMTGEHTVKSLSCVANAVHKLSTQVEKVLREDRLPITIGGDHSLGIGTIAGHAKVNRDLCVIWIDAHADINTTSSSLTGHMHGMPVSFLIKEMASKFENSQALLKYFRGIEPCVSASSFAYIGLRDLDAAEVAFLQQLEPKLSVYSVREIDKLGIFEVISRVLERINPKMDKPIHVSFDIDAIDEYFAPSTGTSVPGGLTIREAFCVGEQIAATKCLAGLDLVEVNPMLGSSADVQRTVNCAINVLLTFLGRDRRSLYARHPSEQLYQAQQSQT